MSDRIEWSVGLSVGVAELDIQHRGLVDLANRLLDGVNAGEAQAVVRETLDALIDYTETHFRREEELMELTGFPLLEQHRGQHKRLMNEVALFKSRFIGGEIPVEELASFLSGWILTHIRDDDRRYTDHLNRHGIR